MKFQQGVMPKHPYRDSALLYAGFAVVFVIITFGTGGNILIAVPAAVGCFLLATAYSWWRIRERLNAEDEEA